ncbi:MAG: hypothetical protein VW338_16005 [Rhodospirillaceae bacterium]
MREFDTGATRDDDDSKPDYEGFLSPLALASFGRYMHRHRRQADGSLRAADNWQAGIPPTAYIKSAWRHFVALWTLHRGLATGSDETIEDACCAILFNVQGYLHEHLKADTAHAVGRPCPSCRQ